MPQSARVLFHEYGTQLRIEPDDSFVLNVLCGRVLEFGVEFALNSEERQNYRQRGDEFVRELSRQVQTDYKPYADRGRTC